MKKVSRYVNLFELKLGHRYKNNDDNEVVDAVDFGTVLSRTNKLPLGALAGVEGSSRYWKKGPDEYIFQSDNYSVRNGFICLRMVRLLGGQIPAVKCGEIELVEVDGADGVGYATHLVIEKKSGNAVVESTNLGPRIGAIRRYYQEILDGDEECAINECTVTPLVSSELMNKFIDEMGKVGSFEIQVYKDVYEQMVAEGDWEQILGENGARLRAAVDGTIALSPEMAVVTVSAGREPYARSGGAGGWLKKFLTKLSQLNETADKPVFRAVKANVEGGEGDADRLGMVDLLNDKTKTRLGVRLNGQGELDSEDMFEKMIAHYQSEFTSIKHQGSEQ